jgi:hypothetical protein
MLRALVVEDIPWESVHVTGSVRREFPTDNLCKTFVPRPKQGRVVALARASAASAGKRLQIPELR